MAAGAKVAAAMLKRPPTAPGAPQRGTYNPLSSPYLGVRSPRAKPLKPAPVPPPPKPWLRNSRGRIVTRWDPKAGRRMPIHKKGKGPVGDLMNTVKGLIP